MKMRTSSTFEPRILDGVKKKSEADIVKLTKLNVAWDCAYSIGDWELCEIISKRIGKINGIEV